jgi:transglutaminase-like putative cysteine protease
MTRQRPPSVLGCLLTLAFVDGYARWFGLRRTLRLVLRAAPTPRTVVRADVVGEVARRVSLAAAFYPRRALCLEQSLALYLLLRRRGIAAELRLGAQPRPFYAHAWVEVDGQPVAEQGDLPLNLTMFPTLGV